MPQHKGKVASSDLQPHVARIINAIDRDPGPGVLTDGTTLRSFYRGMSYERYIEEVNHLHGVLGVVVQRNDRIIDIAERLAVKEMPIPAVAEMEALLPLR